jgi:hypothetical protein
MPEFLQKKLQVFVSSTYRDLIEERQAAVVAILTAGHIPAGMELFTAGDESQMYVIKQWIEESDVFLLILGGRYGSIEPNTGKSYTQLEYEHALRLHKHICAYVIEDASLETRVRNHGTSAIEMDNPEKLKKFKEKVLKGRIVRHWDDSKDIKIEIGLSLSELSRRDVLAGWIRSNSEASFRLVTPKRKELPKEFHDRKYATDKFDLLAVAVKDCLREIAQDPENKMVKRILCDSARCHIIFVHPNSDFLLVRAKEDMADAETVKKLQKDSVKYVVTFYRKLKTFLEQENLDSNKFGNVQIRLIDTNPYVTIERFGDEINWGLYTSTDIGRDCAMFTVKDNQDDKQSKAVFEQIRKHFHALLDHGVPLLTLANGVLEELNYNALKAIFTAEELNDNALKALFTAEELDRLLK